MTETTIPQGYRRDAKGCLVPESMIKPIDLQRDELVRELLTDAIELRDVLRTFKSRVFADLSAFVALSIEQYGVVPRGRKEGGKGNVTFYSFDGSLKINLAIAENMQFDERLQAAKALIDECITEWTQGSRAEIQVLVQAAFQTDKEGNINTGRVLGLRRLEIKDPRWKTAMQAIGESLQVVGSKEYVRFYERVGDSDQYRAVVLDMAGV